MNSIIPDKKDINPYYIFTPKYTRQSAGVKVMHFLCHHLNTLGYPAFIVNFYRNSKHLSKDDIFAYTNPDHIAPILSEDAFLSHKYLQKNPITIYTDTVTGNPLRSSCIARYLLHYPGHLGGEQEGNFNDNELIFCYSQKIKESLSESDSDVLFMPVCNTNIFNMEGVSESKQGSCFYASKYKNVHNGKLSAITKNSVEITRGLPDSQTPDQIAELFKKSEVFYSYEDTALITEALLCGCPVVLVRNKFLKNDPLAVYELGRDGIGFSDDEDLNIDLLRSSVSLAQKRYFLSVENYWDQLQLFIKKTQEHSRINPRSANLRNYKKPSIKRRFQKALRVIFQ